MSIMARHRQENIPPAHPIHLGNAPGGRGMSVDEYNGEPRSQSEEFYPDKFYDIPNPDPPSEESQIVSEISARFLDLKEVNRRRPISLIYKLNRVWKISPALFWITFEILAANRKGGNSLTQIAVEQYVTKQAIHQERNRELKSLAEVMPEVAQMIETILKRKRI